MEDAIWIAILSIVSTCVFVVGWISDIHNKCKVMRSYMKKNVIILSIFDNDGKTIKEIIVNPMGGVVSVGDYIWVFSKNMLWRKEKIVKGDKVEWIDNKEKGFEIKPSYMRYNEGVPILFVDYNSMIPRTIEFQQNASVKAGEFGAWIKDYMINLKLKLQIKEFRDQQKLIFIVIGLCAVLLIGTYLVFSAVNGVMTQLQKTDVKAEKLIIYFHLQNYTGFEEQAEPTMPPELVNRG